MYHLIDAIVMYKENNILKFFFQCFRDFALQWFKSQFIKFTSLNDFKLIITKKFSFVEFVANFDQIIINSSSRFHRYFECDAEFSSTSRFLTHTQKNCSKNFTCKHCEKIFALNNKFHEHVRLHYIKKSYNNKTLKQHFVERKNNHINLSISCFISSITSIVSIAFKSRHYKFTCMFFIFSSNSLRILILSHTASKTYMTMKKLFEMFAEKLSKRNMNIIQKKSIFSCFSESRQTRIKSFRQRNSKDTIMLAKKQFRKNLNAIRKKIRFSFFSMSDQVKITSYFKFVDQSFKSFKFNAFINCFCSTLRIFFSINRATETSQYQQIAIDEISNQREFKSFEMQSLCTFQQKYIVATNVYHINKNIRVETSLTNAKKYNSIKSSIKIVQIVQII